MVSLTLISASGGGKALRLTNNALVLSATEPCCCGCDAPCTVTQSGITKAGFGWSVTKAPTKLPIDVEFKYEDSTNCNGANGSRQIGQISCCVYLSAPSTLELTVSGNVENQQAGFDVGRINVAGVQVEIQGVNAGQGCAMVQKTATKTVSLPAGQHVYTLSADTVDGAFHKNMTHRFKITKQ